MLAGNGTLPLAPTTAWEEGGAASGPVITNDGQPVDAYKPLAATEFFRPLGRRRRVLRAAATVSYEPQTRRWATYCRIGSQPMCQPKPYNSLQTPRPIWRCGP